MGQQTSSEPQQDGPDNPEATWWCRLLARIIGCIGGFMCLISSLWTMITLTKPLCIVAGVLMLLGGAVVLIFEAPICCTFIEITKPIAKFAEKRTFLQKALIYAIIALPPFFMCIGLSSLFGCGLVFAAGVFYGLMGLGRKADRETMMRNANADQAKTDPEANLVNNEVVQDNTNPFSNQPK